MVKMENTSIIIAQHIHHITLNPYEYVLDENGNLMRFKKISDAKEFLRKHGYKKFNGIKFIREKNNSN
jgi:hypothetical protein